MALEFSGLQKTSHPLSLTAVRQLLTDGFVQQQRCFKGPATQRSQFARIPTYSGGKKSFPTSIKSSLSPIQYFLVCLKVWLHSFSCLISVRTPRRALNSPASRHVAHRVAASSQHQEGNLETLHKLHALAERQQRYSPSLHPPASRNPIKNQTCRTSD